MPVPALGLRDQGQDDLPFGDREEVFEAGDAYYVAAGSHPGHNEPGTEFLQFSPTEELAQTRRSS